MIGFAPQVFTEKHAQFFPNHPFGSAIGRVDVFRAQRDGSDGSHALQLRNRFDLSTPISLKK
jgi:hypothetical protein